MALTFPTNPTTGQTYSYGDYTYSFDGTKWTSIKRQITNVFDDVAAMQAHLSLKSGDWVKVINPGTEYEVSFLGSGDILLDNGLYADEVGVIATGSTTARGLPDRFAEVSNVKDFGAVGDGVTDDTVAIQAAVDKGGEVIFPDGTYIISDTITLTQHGTKLKGQGISWIKWADGSYTLTNMRQVYSFGIQYIDIENLHFDGNRANVTHTASGASNVWLEQTRKSNITNCKGRNPLGGALGLNAVFSFIGASYSYTVTNCHIWCDSRDSSYGLVGAIFFQGGNGIATGNTCENLNDAVIVANGPTGRGFVFNNNICIGNGGGNIVVENGASDVTVVGNSIINTFDGYGIGVLWIGTEGDPSNGVTISGNTLRDNLGTGVSSPIAILTGNNVSVIGNDVRGYDSSNANNVMCQVRGNGSTKGMNVTISGNNFHGGTYAMQLDDTTNCDVNNNTMSTDSSSGVGVLLSGSQVKTQLNSNIIRDVSTGISIAGGTTTSGCGITGNHVDASNTNYSLGGTAQFQLEIPSTISEFRGAINITSPITVPAGTTVDVAIDIGTISQAGGPFSTDSYVEGSCLSNCSLTWGYWANSGATAVFRAENSLATDQTISRVYWRAYGDIINYQK